MGDSDEERKPCPACASRGRKGYLGLYKKNLVGAVELCSNAECPYPFSSEFVHSIKKNTEDMMQKDRGPEINSDSDDTVEFEDYQNAVSTDNLDEELAVQSGVAYLNKIVGLMEPDVLEDLFCSSNEQTEAQKSGNLQASASSSSPDVQTDGITEAENKEKIQELIPVEYASEVATGCAAEFRNYDVAQVQPQPVCGSLHYDVAQVQPQPVCGSLHYDVAQVQPQPVCISLHYENNRPVITLPAVEENVRQSPLASAASMGSNSGHIQGNQWNLAAKGNYNVLEEGGQECKDPINEMWEESSPHCSHQPTFGTTQLAMRGRRRRSKGRGSRGKTCPTGPGTPQQPSGPLLLAADGPPKKKRRGRPRSEHLTSGGSVPALDAATAQDEKMHHYNRDQEKIEEEVKKNGELAIKNEEAILKNGEDAIKNENICIKNEEEEVVIGNEETLFEGSVPVLKEPLVSTVIDKKMSRGTFERAGAGEGIAIKNEAGVCDISLGTPNAQANVEIVSTPETDGQNIGDVNKGLLDESVGALSKKPTRVQMESESFINKFNLRIRNRGIEESIKEPRNTEPIIMPPRLFPKVLSKKCGKAAHLNIMSMLDFTLYADQSPMAMCDVLVDLKSLKQVNKTPKPEKVAPKFMCFFPKVADDPARILNLSSKAFVEMGASVDLSKFRPPPPAPRKRGRTRTKSSTNI